MSLMIIVAQFNPFYCFYTPPYDHHCEKTDFFKNNTSLVKVKVTLPFYDFETFFWWHKVALEPIEDNRKDFFAKYIFRYAAIRTFPIFSNFF